GRGRRSEPSDRVRIVGDAMHHRARAGARQGYVVGAIDDAHGALAYEVLDLILTQTRSWFDRHERSIMWTGRAVSIRVNSTFKEVGRRLRPGCCVTVKIVKPDARA